MMRQRMTTVAQMLRQVGAPAEAFEIVRELKLARVSVRRNPRLVSGAGRAGRDDHYRISLHVNLQGDALRDTFLHELAHVVAWARGHENHGHGPDWRRACADLGAPGLTRTHNLPIAPLRGKCIKCGFEIRRRNRIQPGRLVHSAPCRGDIVPIEEETKS